MQHLEPIEHVHMSHSYVRGHWRNSTRTTPIILAKSCHDTDIIRWLVGDTAECEAGLNEAAGFLRNGLFKRLHIHTVPTLHFVFDRTTERAADMNALIAKAVSSRAKED